MLKKVVVEVKQTAFTGDYTVEQEYAAKGDDFLVIHNNDAEQLIINLCYTDGDKRRCGALAVYNTGCWHSWRVLKSVKDNG